MNWGQSILWAAFIAGMMLASVLVLNVYLALAAGGGMTGFGEIIAATLQFAIGTFVFLVPTLKFLSSKTMTASVLGNRHSRRRARVEAARREGRL